MVFPQLVRGDGGLFRVVVCGFENVLHEPFIAGGCAEHTAHQVVAAVGMGKGVERVIPVDAEFLRGDEYGAGGAQADVAAARAHNAGSHSGRGIVSCAGTDSHGFGNAKKLGDLRLHGADTFIAFEELRHLSFRDAADGEHFLRPAFVLNIQKQHTRGIGVIAGMDTGENVVDIILWKHDFGDSREVLRLIFAHPQQLRRGETGKGNVCRQGGELLLADFIVQVIHLLRGTSVIPENGGADHPVVLVQHHQAVHLTAAADSSHLGGIEVPQKLWDTRQHGSAPVIRVLLAPTWLGEFQGVIPCDGVLDLSGGVHQQQLDGRGAEINSDI